MKRKVSELEGALLDAAVAKAEGREHKIGADGLCWIKTGRSNSPSKWDEQFSPSTDWVRGGPIIERARLTVSPVGPGWRAISMKTGKTISADAESLLVAAMRAYVASKFGLEVDLP